MQQQIGRRLRELREVQGWNQVQLAAASGLSVATVSLIEAGQRTPNAETIVKLAGGLGVEPGELFPKDQPSLFSGVEQRREEEEERRVAEETQEKREALAGITAELAADLESRVAAQENEIEGIYARIGDILGLIYEPDEVSRQDVGLVLANVQKALQDLEREVGERVRAARRRSTGNRPGGLRSQRHHEQSWVETISEQAPEAQGGDRHD